MNLDKIINLIREMNEEAPTVSTNSSGATAGFSGGASTPVAGYDNIMGPMTKRHTKKTYAKGGKNSRKYWLDFLRGRS